MPPEGRDGAFVTALDHLFLWVRSKRLLLRFTVFTRILLAAGFIPTGLVKLLGRRFTTIPVDEPIGAFFEAMYQTGMFWNFLGATQVVAGALLLVPRFAHLGAVCFLPIIVSINVINIALGFGLTTAITFLMALAALYLLLWDYHRLRSILTTRPLERLTEVPNFRLDRWETIGFTVFAAALLAVFLSTRGFGSVQATNLIIPLGAAAGLFTLLRFCWIVWRGRSAP